MDFSAWDQDACQAFVDYVGNLKLLSNLLHQELGM